MTFKIEISSLKWTQTMEVKQSHTYFRETYSTLTSYIQLSKNIKVVQWLSKSIFLGSMTTVNPNNGNETKSDSFHGTNSNLISLFIGQKIFSIKMKNEGKMFIV